MVLMFVFLVILCFSILFMYAAIHPDGLVIFSQATLMNTRVPTSPTVVGRNASHKPSRGPPGVTVAPIDPWWIRLAETESPPTRDIPDGRDTIVDWVKRVRIKVANESTKAFHMQPITKSAFASTTFKPKFTRTSTTTPKSRDIPQYDENAILYNYKSYGTSIIKVNTRP
ncbi:hypothetical protein DAPPUDRAFT_323051 [Daphnia pulex]|uniref:Uncharacterized protein n=1 Tax=Daphnia pulex TaxID=6669 RepID=E9GXS4_DAPPU|nr:hypothetical protein DAPPUDRAFT_323051 [Daphnia pulex]|eukprot:EFX75767.1 hypothetical protein DAPPUDRAFT_323051 [Daphnia pulex]